MPNTILKVTFCALVLLALTACNKDKKGEENSSPAEVVNSVETAPPSSAFIPEEPPSDPLADVRTMSDPDPDSGRREESAPVVRDETPVVRNPTAAESSPDLSPADEEEEGPSGSADTLGFGGLTDFDHEEEAPHFSHETPGSSFCSTDGIKMNLPARPRSAESGSQIVARLQNENGTSRDQKVIEQVLAGNIPDSFRALEEVTISTPRGQLTLCVSSDYLSVGSNQDSVRFPLGMSAISSLFQRTNMVLPTKAIVDAAYVQADIKLTPSPKTPNNQMETTRYIAEHDATIDSQLGSRQGFIAGHKKDVVLSDRLLSRPGKIAIYGWHRSAGDPIQPVSTVHHSNYADYSQGVRWVSDKARLGDEIVSLADLVADSTVGPAITGNRAWNVSSVLNR